VVQCQMTRGAVFGNWSVSGQQSEERGFASASAFERTTRLFGVEEAARRTNRCVQKDRAG